MNQNLNRFLLLLIFFSFVSNANECTEAKKIIQNNRDISLNIVNSIKNGVENNDLCYRNLMGIMYFEGIYFERNTDLAEKIFFDVGNEGYPEAQYNYALAISNNKSHPKEFMALVTGIFKKYITSRKYAEIGSAARDLGFNYLGALKKTEINISFLRDLEFEYSEEIKKEHQLISDNALRNTQKILENSQTIASLLAIGLLSYTVSNMPSANASQNMTYTQSSNPWWDGNPMKLNLYQWPKP